VGLSGDGSDVADARTECATVAWRGGTGVDARFEWIHDDACSARLGLVCPDGNGRRWL